MRARLCAIRRVERTRFAEEPDARAESAGLTPARVVVLAEIDQHGFDAVGRDVAAKPAFDEPPEQAGPHRSPILEQRLEALLHAREGRDRVLHGLETGGGDAKEPARAAADGRRVEQA